jgi:hypothetical protein
MPRTPLDVITQAARASIQDGSWLSGVPSNIFVKLPTVQDLVEQLGAIVEREELGRISLAGISLGGLVA